MYRISHNRSFLPAILAGLGIGLALGVSAPALAQSGEETQSAEKMEQKPLVEWTPLLRKGMHGVH